MKMTSLRRKIANMLRKTTFHDPRDSVHVYEGELPDHIHVLVISPKFRGVDDVDTIMSLLQSELSSEEWSHVTLARGLAPEAMNGMSLREIKLYT